MNQSEPNSKPGEVPLGIGDAFVAICDWTGKVRWLSNHTISTKIGDLGWSNMVPDDADLFREAFAMTATMHEKRVVEIASLNGLRYRIWLMSIGIPDLAVCTFNLRIPPEIEELSERERELMNLLAQGNSLKEAAATMDCSINTIHSHTKNIKAKLNLGSANEVASFASRFFNNLVDPLKIGEPCDVQLRTTGKASKALKNPATKKKPGK